MPRFERTGGLMGDLSKESSNLSLAGVQVAGPSEPGETTCSADEGGVGVESLGRACTVVLVQEDGVVELLGDDRRDAVAVRAVAGLRGLSSTREQGRSE